MRRSPFIVAVCCLALGCFAVAPVASASDSSVRQAIERSSKEAKQSGELASALKTFKEDPKTLAKLHAGIAKFTAILRKIVTKVSAQSASTTTGKKGKALWVAGADAVIKGFTDLDKAITDIKDHQKPAARTEAKKAVLLVKEGGVLLKKGSALLHVK